MALAAGLSLAAEDAAAERKRIATERAIVEQRFQAQQAECAQRFAVNACLDSAPQARREALSPLRQQELLLADAERRQRAQQCEEDPTRCPVDADAAPQDCCACRDHHRIRHVHDNQESKSRDLEVHGLSSLRKDSGKECYLQSPLRLKGKVHRIRRGLPHLLPVVVPIQV